MGAANGPMAVFLTVALLDLIRSGRTGFDLELLALLLRQFGIGALGGVALGLALAGLRPRVRLAPGLNSLLVVGGRRLRRDQLGRR